VDEEDERSFKKFAFNAPLQRINLSLQSEVTRPIRSTIGAFPRAAAKVEHRHLACSITPEAGTPSRTSWPHVWGPTFLVSLPLNRRGRYSKVQTIRYILYSSDGDHFYIRIDDSI